SLTMPSVWSKPEDWVTAYLHRIEPALEGPQDFVALGFGEPSRAVQLKAVADELLQLCRDDPHDAAGNPAEGSPSVPLAVVPELTVADPEAVAATLGQLLAAWRTGLAGRSPVQPRSWKEFGQNIFQAVEGRLLAAEESIPLILKGLARLERLTAICNRADGTRVVIDDPITCPAAPRTIPGLHDKVRFIRFPIHWDATDAEANRKLALMWKQGLEQERASRPVEGPELHVLVGIVPDEVPTVARWLSGLQGRRAVLLMRHDQLSSCEFECDRFHDIDLIPT